MLYPRVLLLVSEWGLSCVPEHSNKIWFQNLEAGPPGEQWPQVAIGREGGMRSVGSLLSSLLLYLADGALGPQWTWEQRVGMVPTDCSS